MKHIATVSIEPGADEYDIEHLLDYAIDGDNGLVVEPSEKIPDSGVYEIYRRRD